MRLAARLPTHRVARLAAVAIVAVALLAAARLSADDAGTAWAALRAGGHVALIRHASAPGTGDPAGFRLDDCATQRNLSAAGRAEAQTIGASFRAHDIAVAGVYSSQWCRCLDTARLLDLGPVEPLAPLNSFFASPDQEAAQMAALRAWLGAHEADAATVLVTHQVVVTALSGIFPRSGEIVVARVLADGGLRVVGRIPPPG